MADKYQYKEVIGKVHTESEGEFLQHLKNFLNKNLNSTNLGQPVTIVEIHSLFVNKWGKKYGCMGIMSDKERNFNHNNFYGMNMPDDHYPGSFDFTGKAYNIFLRNYKLKKIMERG